MNEGTRTTRRRSSLTEKDWQHQVVQLATQLGWKRAYHVYDSRRSHSGWPDLVLVRDRIVYLELKRETGKLSDAQKGWLTDLRSAGADAYIARPRDLEHLAATLASRGYTHGEHALNQSTLAELT
jgi:hypothetical protein